MLIGGGPTLAGGALVFEEIAADLGMDVVHSPAACQHPMYVGGGAAGDFNNDGWQDLFVVGGGGGNVPDRLFINNGDGTFTDQAAAWGLATPHRGKGASVGDFNGDGWLDLYETSDGPIASCNSRLNKLYRNNGNGTFTDVAASAGVNDTVGLYNPFGSAFGDYDLDGDLDLFVASHGAVTIGSRLFRNNGDETFTDVTTAAGFTSPPGSVAGFTPRWVDMDGDWYPEMLLVADFGTSRYYRNNANGTFTDVTASSDTGQETDGMGSTTGDFNNDGRIDWYATSIYFAGNGNKLYLNIAAHLYFEVANVYGVHNGGYGWGALAVDFNHDGRLDIAETNGDGHDIIQSYLWIQNPGPPFSEVALVSGFVHFGQGRGMSGFDYDNDGDQDVVIFGNDERLYFFRNDLSGPDTNWLRVFLDTSAAPGLAPNGIGARVRATAGGATQLRYMISGDNFLSHSELSVHFGLGGATTVDELLVEWPDGTTTQLSGVPANQTLTVTRFPLGDVDMDGDVDVVDFLLLLGAWGPCPAPCPPACAADLDGNCQVDVVDFLMLLKHWT